MPNTNDETADEAQISAPSDADIMRNAFEDGETVHVEAGRPDTDEYDTGIILDVDGTFAEVGWNSGVRTWTAINNLRPL